MSANNLEGQPKVIIYVYVDGEFAFKTQKYKA